MLPEFFTPATQDRFAEQVPIPTGSLREVYSVTILHQEVQQIQTNKIMVVNNNRNITTKPVDADHHKWDQATIGNQW